MMEDNKEYKAVNDIITNLEQQAASLHQRQDLSMLRRDTEEHFERCIHALEVRRDTLLSELDELTQQQEELMEDIQEQIKEAIQSCTDIMRSGVTLYKKNISRAENLWQTARDFELPDVEQKLAQLIVEVNLPLSLIDWIDNHGQVTVQDITITSTTPSAPSTSPTIISETFSIQSSYMPSSPANSSTIPSNTSATTSSIIPSAATIPSAQPFTTLPSYPSTHSTQIPANFGATSVAPSVNSPAVSVTTTATSPAVNPATVTPTSPTTIPSATTAHTTSSTRHPCSFAPPIRFSAVEMVTTLAGSDVEGHVDSNGPNSRFNYPLGICMNPRDQCLYVCDPRNYSIRKVTLQGIVTTFVATVIKHGGPRKIVMDYIHNIFFVTCYNNTILKITSSGAVSVFAGSGGKGSSNGLGIKASFNIPYGIVLDQQTGTLFVSDCDNHLIRKITPEGEVSTLAGSKCGFADGRGHVAKFNGPEGICYDSSDESLVVCDNGNSRLRRVRLNGDVTTICEIEYPLEVVLTANKTLIVSTALHQIYKVTQKGPDGYEVVVLAGSGVEGRVDGRANECQFSYPRGMAVDESSHSCFVADMFNHSIRRMTFKG